MPFDASKPSSSASDSHAFLAGGGEATDLILAREWGDHPLGAPEAWPDELKATLSLILNSPESMILCWGREELTFFFNEAYFPLLGPRLDWAMGAPFHEVWADAWDQAQPIIKDAFAGRSQHYEDAPWKLGTDRGREDTWFSFSYSRILDPAGEVAGLFIFTNETTDRFVADEALRASEAKWRGLFATLQEGFLLGELIRDDTGRAIDWRYEEVNDAWHELVGVAEGSAIGRTVREVIPDIEEAWIAAFSKVVATGMTARFTERVGPLDRWYDCVAQPAGGDHFTVIFSEATERVERSDRQAAVVALTDVLQNEAVVTDLIVAASGIIGRTLNVELVGYGNVDDTTETITVERDWTGGGAQSLAGTRHFRDYGSYIEDFKRGHTVIVADCRLDPRTRDHAAALEERSARAFVNIPIFERGRFVALLYVSSVRPRNWSKEDIQFLEDAASRLRVGVQRIRAEEQQDFLNKEIVHRLKNTLAMVQSIANLTLKDHLEPGAINVFARRLTALGSAQSALLEEATSPVDLAELVNRVLNAAGVTERYKANGPAVRLGPRSALSSSLLLHELTTNALKYGALSGEGTIEIDWKIEEREGQQHLDLNWNERGGPPAEKPTSKGFGSRLIRMGLAGSGGSKLDYGPEGLSASFEAPISDLTRS